MERPSPALAGEHHDLAATFNLDTLHGLAGGAHALDHPLNGLLRGVWRWPFGYSSGNVLELPGGLVLPSLALFHAISDAADDLTVLAGAVPGSLTLDPRLRIARRRIRIF
jgi:hypothetical protein